MKKLSILIAAAALFCACGPSDGIHRLTVLATDDVHGAWFDSSYVDGCVRTSLTALNTYVDSVRVADGAKNVLFVDAGDCLQGDNAAYYYNYVDTKTEHLFVRICDYMKYDAVVVGNHDVETGHPVYDRVTKQLRRRGIPFLAGNAVRTDNGKPYWPAYKVFRKAGLKVLLIGYTNPNMKAWLDESIWSGMDFKNLIPLAQEDVDRLKARYNPQVTIVAIHSGTGLGDGSMLESQALDLYQSLRGVDLILCAHDHRQTTRQSDSIALINTGTKAKFLGIGKIEVEVKDGTVAAKSLSAGLIPVDKNRGDAAMRKAFREDYEAVKAFTLREVGMLTEDLYTRDAYAGMCDYISLLHTVQLAASGAKVSLAAPLTYNGKVNAGVLLYNDMFTIYPFENTLFKMDMTGAEIKSLLEYAYDIRLAAPGSGHVLDIVQRDDPRNNQTSWSFRNRSYNFDSAAGISYTVDIDKPAGSRITILGFADGTPFDKSAHYPVAMTSYRANSGGDLMIKGAGIPKDELASRITGKYPEIRELIYRFVEEKGILDHDTMENRRTLGEWRFIPEKKAERGIAADMALLFPARP
ncbi:MAG: bifunctional metallophosphatase/5'-nucleotidase [Bacteroidales bacterium]|nr:bifunctional metallophosphatase/5'-nucleotidase [Bacteroidales bacterium]